MKTLPSLQTERLILRPITMDHADELHRIVYADPDVALSYSGEVKTPDQTRAVLTHSVWLNRHSGDQGWGSWVVTRKEDSMLIGRINLGRPDRTYYTILEEDQNSPFVPLDTEIGYAFGKTYWGQGYASEAAQAVIDYAFHTLHIPRIVTPADDDNLRSRMLLKRLGFRMQNNVHPEYPGTVGVLENPTVTHAAPLSKQGLSSLLEKWRKKEGPPFETDQFLIRGLEFEDCEAIDQIVRNAPEAAQYFGLMHSYEIVSGDLLFVHESPTGSRIREGYSGKNEGLGSFVIQHRDKQHLIGLIHLGPAARNYWIDIEQDTHNPCARFEVDFTCFIDPAVYNQSCAIEACQPLIDFALHDLRLARLVTHINNGNVPAVDCARHLGFRIEKNLHPDYGGCAAILDSSECPASPT